MVTIWTLNTPAGIGSRVVVGALTVTASKAQAIWGADLDLP